MNTNSLIIVLRKQTEGNIKTENATSKRNWSKTRNTNFIRSRRLFELLI